MSDLQRWTVGMFSDRGLSQAQDEDGHWVEYDQAVDLIEQQQAEIDTLKSILAFIEQGEQATIAHQRKEIDDLRSANKEAKDFINDYISPHPISMYPHEPFEPMKALAEAVRNAFMAGFDASREGFNGECECRHLSTGDNYENSEQLAEQYANKIKAGEK